MGAPATIDGSRCDRKNGQEKRRHRVTRVVVNRHDAAHAARSAARPGTAPLMFSPSPGGCCDGSFADVLPPMAMFIIGDRDVLLGVARRRSRRGAGVDLGAAVPGVENTPSSSSTWCPAGAGGVQPGKHPRGCDFCRGGTRVQRRRGTRNWLLTAVITGADLRAWRAVCRSRALRWVAAARRRVFR